MIFTMSIKQHIYNKDEPFETTEAIEGCQNISYTKMSDHYYQWEMYSSISKSKDNLIYPHAVGI